MQGSPCHYPKTVFLLKKSGQTNITTRSWMNREIHWKYLRGEVRCPAGFVIRLNKNVQVLLQAIQGDLKLPSQGRQKKFFQQKAVKLLAQMIIVVTGLVLRKVPNVRCGQKILVRVYRKQSTIFTGLPGVDF